MTCFNPVYLCGFLVVSKFYLLSICEFYVAHTVPYIQYPAQQMHLIKYGELHIVEQNS
jgi:hypothetical protein